MRRTTLALAALAATVTAAAGPAPAQAPAAKSAPRIVEVKPRNQPFSTIRVNGAIAALRNARAGDVIATFFPMHPLVGRENLPADRRFDVDLNPMETTPEGVLAGLSRALGLSIRDAESTTEFLVVRNETRPVPAGWIRVSEADLLEFGMTARGPHGITEVDATDHFHTAYYVTMPQFAHFVGDRASRPVWNQTSLLGHYCFSFRLHGDNVLRTLADLGFDAFVRTGTTRCVVVSPKAAPPAADRAATSNR